MAESEEQGQLNCNFKLIALCCGHVTPPYAMQPAAWFDVGNILVFLDSLG